jgi:peroxiredoxin family protein
MTTELFIRYSAVVLTIIALNHLVQLFFSFYGINFMKKNVKENSSTSEINYQKIMEDLDKLIQRKCFTAYRRALQPYVSKALKNRPLINDKVVNEITIQLTNEILNEMSDAYKSKLEIIYKAELIKDIILELVYNTVTEMAMKINKDSIDKMNFINNIGSINRRDFDN